MPATPAFDTIVLQALGALVISLISSWVTVLLAQRRFRDERMWDRKISAYERIIDAFHKSKNFASVHLDALYENRTITDERAKQLQVMSAEARDEIQRAIDIGSFILSAQAMEF